MKNNIVKFDKEEGLQDIFDRKVDPVICNNTIYPVRTYYNEVIDAFKCDTLINKFNNIQNKKAHNNYMNEVFKSRAIFLYNSTIAQYMYKIESESQVSIWVNKHYDFDIDHLKICDINTYLDENLTADLVVAFTSYLIRQFQNNECLETEGDFIYIKNQFDDIANNIFSIVVMYVDILKNDAITMINTII